MKKYLLLLLPFFASCHDKVKDVSAIWFTSRYNWDYTTDIIIGKDTQTVDSIYNREFNFYYTYGGRTTGDSFSCSLHVRKYYISRGLNNLIMAYMKDHCDKKVNCDSVGRSNVFVLPEYIYYIKSINKRSNGQQCCMERKQDALVYFIGLKNKIVHSPYYNKQCIFMLKDLRTLFDAERFFPTPEKQLWLLKHATPDDKEDLINRWHYRQERYEKELKEVEDSLYKTND